MAKQLVIVESPAKAKTINRYLGNDYVVTSSVGHVRDLPVSGGQKAPVDHAARAREAAKTRKMAPEEKAAHKARKAREQLVRRMGVDPDNDWQATYDVLPGKEKVVSELQRLARDAETIYLATDLDREGEAIAWHLREVIGGPEERFRRVVFNEITRKAIEEAFSHPGQLDMNRVQAQQARRFLDRVVGYEVSPLLWSKIARGLSAGRVQSVAVRLIVEREREIQAFVPEEYWELFAELRMPEQTAADAPLRFQTQRRGGANFRPGSEVEVGESLEVLRPAVYTVTDREDRRTTVKPSAPFITSTLQQAASTRLGFSVKKTMTLAQRLYEAGHITYMRTDSTNLSADALAAVRARIDRDFGADYLPEAPIRYGSREGAQEAHEAIRPSNVEIDPDRLGSGVEADAQRLYELIWRRFVACQMPPANYISTTLTVTAPSGVTDVAAADVHELQLKGRVLKFDGFTRVLPPTTRGDDDRVVPEIPIGTRLDLVALDPQQHFTKPPPRFGEASLVRELEKRGIGRPSTYAAIISTIQDRGYVTLKNRRFHAEKIGEIVTSRLTENFEDLLDYGFTAQMEERLDQIAEGQMGWRDLLDQFYADFRGRLEQASGDDGMRANDPTEVAMACPACGRGMVLRTGSTGVFLGCSGYDLPPKERCTQTINLIPGDEIADVDADEDAESKLLRSKRRCELCGTSMDAYLIDENHKLHVCGRNPDCAGHALEEGTFRIKGYEGPTIECDKCGADMQLKSGRFGKYFGCTADACSNTRKLLRNGQPAPPKMDPVPMPELACEKVEDTYVLRDGAAGLFLAASQFPKHRETRAPRVKELVSHQNEIDPKYGYLFSAPVEDDAGRDTIVRYSRKNGIHYVQTEVDGKPSGWKAEYEDGAWVVTKAAPAKAKAKTKTKARPKARTKSKAGAKSKPAARSGSATRRKASTGAGAKSGTDD